MSRTASSVSIEDVSFEDDSRVLCGKKPAAAVSLEMKRRLDAIRPLGVKHLGRGPCLAVILVGDRSDSRLYIKIKKREAAKLGIEVRVMEMDAESTTPELLRDAIELHNKDETVDGLIVQVPLPAHLPVSLCQNVAPEKDVDGFNYSNMGKLALNGIMVPFFSPCTPRGVLQLLEYYDISVAGKSVVILGRSSVVGLPLSLMLLAQDATVTICHSKTLNVRQHTQQADILIAAMGQPHAVTSDWVRSDAVIVDVGVSVVRQNGRSKVLGDVDGESVLRDTSEARITPVPGGVGPLTVAMLMKATVEAFERRVYAKEMLSEH